MGLSPEVFRFAISRQPKRVSEDDSRIIVRSPNRRRPKITKIKVLFAFFSISLLLFSGTVVMASYAQPQKVPSQGEQLLPQLQQQQQKQLQQQQQQQKQLAPQLQQELQDAMQEKGEESRIKKIPNGFDVDEEFSVGKVLQILNQTLPSGPLRAQILGPTENQTLLAATENQALQARPSINTPPPPAVLLNPPSKTPVSDSYGAAKAAGCRLPPTGSPTNPGWATVHDRYELMLKE